MKFYNLIIMFAMLLGSALASAANIPSVAQVESSIASGDYPEARKLLGEVLKANPDSYVANRYMFEIVKIENGRDNTPSVEYLLYEDRINKITQQTEQRKLAEAKAKQEKEDAERTQSMLNVLYTLFALIAFGGLSFLGYRKYQVQQHIKNEKKKFDDWSERATADMLDIEQGLNKASVMVLGSYNASLLDDLIADNADALEQVLKADVNMSAIDRHIKNAKQFLKENGVNV